MEVLSGDLKKRNLVIILIDGLRWQEVFRGADTDLISNPAFTPDPHSLRSLFRGETKGERRKKLLPFFWNIISEQGLLFGDRDLNSKVNASNLYSVSYPGYNEIFTGTTDIFISGNKKVNNRNINVLEWLVRKRAFENNIAVFSSWNVFPYILNAERSGLRFDTGPEENEEGHQAITIPAKDGIQYSKDTRHDMLTYTHAKEYIKKYHTRITVIAFGEADVLAHERRYDLYLQQINQADTMIGELWNIIQTTKGYRNNTNFLITTDHGRGNTEKNWHDHGIFVRGSSQTWLALIGPAASTLKMKNGQICNKQFAGVIARLVGEEFPAQKDLRSLKQKMNAKRIQPRA